jgi:hypothetical protein
MMTPNADPPVTTAQLPEDVRWEAIPYEAFESALNRYRFAKHTMTLALLDPYHQPDALTKYSKC